MVKKIAVFGGVYSNHLALEATIKDALQRNVQEIYCLGDLGAFGPNPDKVFPVLKKHNVKVIQGNYDNSIGNDLNDCQCGYTDPRDNYFAKLSYAYTYKNTSNSNKQWMKNLPEKIRLKLNGHKILLIHGSPRKMNEFLWESTTPDHFLEKLFTDYDADIICASHTGIHWKRKLNNGRWFINVGVIGRPENDGRTNVWYSMIEFDPRPKIHFIPVKYDYLKLAREMEAAQLPKEFIDTIQTGWWTTCLEILPHKERKSGKY